MKKKHVQIAVAVTLGITALMIWLFLRRDSGPSGPYGGSGQVQEEPSQRRTLRHVGSGGTLVPPSGGKDESFASTLEGLSAQEKNARIVDKLMEEEFRRVKSINESDSPDEYRYTIEINGPSPAELKELMKIVSLAEGTVGESRLFFARNAPPDRPLKEYLLEAFFLQAGNDITKITISAPKKNPRTSSYSTSTRLKGTRTRAVSGGIDEPLEASGRFGKFFEPVDQEKD